MDTLTRGMLVTVLYRMVGAPASGESSFSDVASDGYYADAVAWVSANNIVNGVGDNRFAPDDKITREQMAAILYRYAAFENYKTTGRANLNSFTDASSISGYALDAMQWANTNGLMSGFGDGTIAPTDNAQRAQVAAVLMRFCANIVN